MSNSLARLDGAVRALAEARTLDEIKQIHDKAQAAAEYARAAKLGLDAQNYAAEIKLRAERKAGELLAGLERATPQTANPAGLPISNGGNGVTDYRAVLDDTDTSYQQAHRWQKIAAMPEQKFEAFIENTKAAGDELTTAGVLRVAAAPDVDRVNARGDYEWYTPQKYVEAARRVLGVIDLDPASSETANARIGARFILTQADDGLTCPWYGRVWLNPPYGGLQADFTTKLLTEYKAGNVTEAILLVNANSTDTRWFAGLWDHTLCFTDHRINFDGVHNSGTGSTHGSVFAYLGAARDLFASVFSKFGAVVVRYGN